MATARDRLVMMRESGSGHGGEAGVGAGLGLGLGLGVSVGAGAATGSAAGTGTGYESPSEDNLPPFFSSPYSGATTAAAPATAAAYAQSRIQQHVAAASASASASATATGRRPRFAQRPSFYTAATAPHLLPENSNSNSNSNSSPASNGLSHGHSLASSLNHVMATSEKTSPNHKVGFRDRIACYQWTYFTMTMSTGGIANILHALKWNPSWIYGIGVFFVLLNIILFLANCVLLTIRFRLRPDSFTRSFTDQFESLFIPAFFVSIAVIMINICQYGIPNTGSWLLRTMEFLFWIHAAVSVCASAGLYLILWSTLVFPVHTMTPTWVFPAYPLLLNAPFAANLISAAQKSDHDLSLDPTAMALGAATLQGTGCLIAFMISAAFIYRLMTQKLPRDTQRPGIFMSIGPYGFTAAGIAQLGNQAESIMPPTLLGTPHVAAIIKVVCVLVSLWLWGLAMWFFIVCVGSLWKYARPGSSMPFQMTWWSFVFPNTALVTATSVMGDVFESNGLHIFACVMTVGIMCVWAGVFVKMIWGLKTGKLLWPKSDV